MMSIEPILVIGPLIKLFILLAVPIGSIILLVYFFRQRRREKREEAEKDYSQY
mgnify:CR=1 FL=1